MDASEASTFNKAVDWYKGRGHWFSPPMIQYTNGVPTVHTTGPDLWPHLPPSLASSASPVEDGWSIPFDSLQSIYTLQDRLKSDLAEYYRYHIRSHLLRLVREGGRRFGALVIEPVCLGAGGMVFVDPLFQACMIEVVRASGDLFGGKGWDGSSYETELLRLSSRDPNAWQGLPIIYDEGESQERVRLTSSILWVTSIRISLGRFCSQPDSRHCSLRQDPHRWSSTYVDYSSFSINLQRVPIRQESRRSSPRSQLHCQSHWMLGRSGINQDGRKTSSRRWI